MQDEPLKEDLVVRVGSYPCRLSLPACNACNEANVNEADVSESIPMQVPFGCKL